MRIVHLTGSVLPSREANGVNVTRMCQAWAAQGHAVTLVGRRGTGDGDVHAHYGVERGFAIRRLDAAQAGAGAQLRFALQARAWALGAPAPDLFYGRHLLALALAPARGAPRVYEAHGAPRGRSAWLLRALARRGALARVVAISGALADAILACAPALAGRVIVAHDAADPPQQDFDALPVPPAAPGAPLRVGYVGQLYPGKGMEMVVALAQRLAHCEFHVVGGDEAELARWRPRVAPLANLVLHGFVPPAQTDAYRMAMDVLLAPYQRRVRLRGGVGDVARWMSPLKIFEYMAAGRAIVASDLPVLREVLGDGREAVLVPPDDVEAWARALARLADPAQRKALGERARARFLQRHTWPSRAARVLEGLA